MIRGSCLCGALRFEYSRAVTQVGMCHCSQCRKVSGVASNAVIVVPEAELRWLAGEEWDEITGDAPQFEEGIPRKGKA